MKTKLTAQDWGLMIGQQVICEDIMFVLDSVHCQYGDLELGDGSDNRFDAVFCKPILRELDQMTDGEKKEYGKKFLANYTDLLCISYDDDGLMQEDCLFDDSYPGNFPIREPEKFDWLTQKGFDVRGWVDAGLAVKKGV